MTPSHFPHEADDSTTGHFDDLRLSAHTGGRLSNGLPTYPEVSVLFSATIVVVLVLLVVVCVLAGIRNSWCCSSAFLCSDAILAYSMLKVCE